MGAKLREFVESCLPCQAAQARTRLEESTDSDFTITYEGVPVSPEQGSEEERVRLDVNTSEDSVSPGRSME